MDTFVGDYSAYYTQLLGGSELLQVYGRTSDCTQESAAPAWLVSEGLVMFPLNVPAFHTLSWHSMVGCFVLAPQQPTLFPLCLYVCFCKAKAVDPCVSLSLPLT